MEESTPLLLQQSLPPIVFAPCNQKLNTDNCESYTSYFLGWHHWAKLRASEMTNELLGGDPFFPCNFFPPKSVNLGPIFLLLSICHKHKNVIIYGSRIGLQESELTVHHKIIPCLSFHPPGGTGCPTSWWTEKSVNGLQRWCIRNCPPASRWIPDWLRRFNFMSVSNRQAQWLASIQCRQQKSWVIFAVKFTWTLHSKLLLAHNESRRYSRGTSYMKQARAGVPRVRACCRVEPLLSSSST